MMYFGSIETVSELKSEYRKLVLENHPDKGGDAVKMRDIIASYKDILENGFKEVYKAYEEITADDVDEYFDDVADLMDDIYENDFVDMDYV